MGLSRIITGAFAGFILVSIIYIPEFYSYIPGDGLRGVIIMFIGGFVAGLVSRSSLGGAIAGIVTALMIPSLNVLREIENLESYVKWLQETQLGEGLKYIIVAAIGGFVGGYLTTRRTLEERI